MRRILEPELMDDPVQAAAYAAADFSEPHNRFVEKFCEVFPEGPPRNSTVLDLGCGPADVCVRFARAWPECVIHGVDGSAAMLHEGAKRLHREGLAQRIHLFRGIMPGLELPEPDYAVVLSNSLLHHLHAPSALWDTIRRYSKVGTLVYILDLLRPVDARAVNELVNTYSSKEPDVLKRDFYNSLCAAFTPEEVHQQLHESNLGYLQVDIISDRHLLIHGKIQNVL